MLNMPPLGAVLLIMVSLPLACRSFDVFLVLIYTSLFTVSGSKSEKKTKKIHKKQTIYNISVQLLSFFAISIADE